MRAPGQGGVDTCEQLAEGGQTLSREFRIRRTAEFQVIQRTGQRMVTQHLIAMIRSNDGLKARFGLAVSRKVGNAVVRNRVKRWLRESIRRERARIQSTDVVFIARPSVREADYAAVRREVADLLSRSEAFR